MSSLRLHVTNGDSAGNTLRRTTLGGAVLAWRDTLHEGPVPDLPRGELLGTRAGFLADCGWGSRQAVLASLERRDAQFLEALHDNTHVVLWFEHDVYDQLQLLDVLTLAHAEQAAPELIVIGSFPGRPSFTGLGDLTARELETLWPSRRAAEATALEAAAEAWATFQAPEPTALAGWATRETPQLPFLAPALRRLLEELPAPANGLSRTERQALETIAAGARTPSASFAASQRLEDAPFLGDTWFFRTLAVLGRGEARLIETEDGQLRLTDRGERTLRGEADRVELLGIDRWIGGTHLTPDNTWRWDTAEAKLLSPR